MKNNISQNLVDFIGNTPILELAKFDNQNNLFSRIFAKLEFFNPLSSAKDRVAFAMIQDAEEKGLINKNSTIIEATSGNTGIGLAFVGASLGYKVIIVMPDNMSIERRKIISQLGAKVVLTPAEKGMKGSIDEAENLHKAVNNSYMPCQFENHANPNIHKKTTAKEIWEAMEGKIDIFVACVGTGGTLTGIGEYLKEKNKNIKIIAVEPKKSPFLSEGKAGKHGIEGIGAGFVPKILNTEIFEEVITVDDDEAFFSAKQIARIEGLLLGISSGAALYASTVLAKRIENRGKNIVTLFPDSGEKYITTQLFD